MAHQATKKQSKRADSPPSDRWADGVSRYPRPLLGANGHTGIRGGTPSTNGGVSGAGTRQKRKTRHPATAIQDETRPPTQRPVEAASGPQRPAVKTAPSPRNGPSTAEKRGALLIPFPCNVLIMQIEDAMSIA